jgi:hypothetical protein
LHTTNATVSEGAGTALGDIENVNKRLSMTKLDEPILKKLHKIVYPLVSVVILFCVLFFLVLLLLFCCFGLQTIDAHTYACMHTHTHISCHRHLSPLN